MTHAAHVLQKSYPTLPALQSERWQSKQTHGWNHTERKKTEVEVSSGGTILEIKTTEKL